MRLVKNSMFKVALQIGVRREGKTRGRRRNQCSTLLGLLMRGLARARFNAQRMPSKNFGTAANSGGRVALISKSSTEVEGRRRAHESECLPAGSPQGSPCAQWLCSYKNELQ